MRDQTSKFLHKVAEDKNLTNNILSVILAKNPNLDISKPELFLDSVKRFYEDYKDLDRNNILDFLENNEVSEISNWEHQDLRISKISISNLRAFPQSELPFGIDFRENNEISSYIIIGNNGTGKSSLFNALEYTYTKRIGEASLRTNKTLDDDDAYFKEYLQHYETPFSECQFNVFTKVGTIFNLHKENIPPSIRKVVNPNNHFISEFDITSNCRLDFETNNMNSFNDLIAKNVGLSDLLEINNNLYLFIEYSGSESTNVKRAKAHLDDTNNTIETYSKALNKNKKSLRKNWPELSEEREESSLEKLELIKELKKKKYFVDHQYSDLKKDIAKFNEEYLKLNNSISKMDNISELTFLELGLSLLHESQDCPFCKNSKLPVYKIETSTLRTIDEYRHYSKLTSTIETLAIRILETLIFLTNKLYLLKNQIDQEVLSTSNFFISNEYNQAALSIKNLLNSIIFDNTVILIRDNKDMTNREAVSFVNRLIDSHEHFIYGFLPHFLETLHKLSNTRESALLKFEIETNGNSEIRDVISHMASLKSEIAEIEKQIIILQKEAEDHFSRYEDSLRRLNFYEQVKREATDFRQIVHKEINIEIEKVFKPLKSIIVNVLNDYLNESRNSEMELIIENEPDQIERETGTIISSKIVAYIKTNNNSARIPVNKYFNTFHYKLFCTMIAISIAIASREKSKINLPLVIDDIFYSSDFENRATIEKFIQKLFSLFKQYTPDMPLQLIMFTHDNLIFDSAIHALNDSDQYRVNFAKLFPPNQATFNGDYKNIISKIPSSLPHKIFSINYA